MNRRVHSGGFSLIEVLVAILVLAVGMLGIAALQATALRNSQSSFERSQAVVESYSIIDAMRANRDAAIIGGYDIDWTCTAPDSDDLVTAEQRAWIQSIQTNLGTQACGRISCDDTDCVVGVRWSDARGTGDSAGYDLDAYVVETRTAL